MLDPGGAPVRSISAVERGLVVDADPEQLFRIMLNLCAMRCRRWRAATPAIPGRDQIRITGRREGAVAMIEVSDAGPGLSERARAHLFEPSRARPAPAAWRWASPSWPSWCAPMAATSAWWKAPSAPPSASPIPDRAVDIDARRGERPRVTATDRV